MFSLAKILLPVDFSERCHGAAHYVQALAKRFNSELTMVHVLPPPHYEFSAMEVGGTVLNEMLTNRAEQVKQELSGYLSDELKQFRVTKLLEEGDPAKKIIEIAHNGGHNLIAMPTHGYGPFRRFILGSVTAKVLHDADCPVWTGVHLEQAPEMDAINFRTVVAAIDLGPQSERTLAWASNFSCGFGAQLLIVNAFPSLEGKTGEYFDPDWRTYFAKEISDKINEMRRKINVQGEIIVESGDPPAVVCGVADTHKADLMVIGRGSAAGLFGRLRTNAYAIIRQSPCPVVSV